MKVLITSPINTISPKLSSHRSAEAHIYEDKLKHLGYEVVMDYGGKETDYSNYDEIYVYHGNDWSGSLNLFGGMNNQNLHDRIKRLSEAEISTVASLGIEFPDYASLFKKRLEKKPMEMWDDINWDNLHHLTGVKVWNGHVDHWTAFVLGDSHAISMYRSGYNVQAIPFKTLHGAMKIGFDQLFKDGFNGCQPPYRVEFYFGNIDIRHHLCRQEEPYNAASDLANNYIEECSKFQELMNCEVAVYEPLPIETTARKIPKTGWYKNAPYYGTWEERNAVRDVFIEILKEGEIELIEWTEGLKNEREELDTKYMEKPQSVHLSREFYPWWQGSDKPELIKKPKKEPDFGTLESFL